MKVNLKNVGAMAHQTQNIVLAAFVAVIVALLALVGVLLMKHGTMSPNAKEMSHAESAVVEKAPANGLRPIKISLAPRGVTNQVKVGSGIVSAKLTGVFDPSKM